MDTSTYQIQFVRWRKLVCEWKQATVKCPPQCSRRHLLFENCCRICWLNAVYCQTVDWILLLCIQWRCWPPCNVLDWINGCWISRDRDRATVYWLRKEVRKKCPCKSWQIQKNETCTRLERNALSLATTTLPSKRRTRVKVWTLNAKHIPSCKLVTAAHGHCRIPSSWFPPCHSLCLQTRLCHPSLWKTSRTGFPNKLLHHAGVVFTSWRHYRYVVNCIGAWQNISNFIVNTVWVKRRRSTRPVFKLVLNVSRFGPWA